MGSRIIIVIPGIVVVCEENSIGKFIGLSRSKL